MSTDPHAALYDPGDVVCFGAAHPVIALDSNGDAHFWLLDLEHQHHAQDGCCQPHVPAHEHTGPLPREYKLTVSRCSAVASSTRRRCRNPARPPSERCHQHQDQGGRC